jgi:hypothetical protein
MKPRFRAGWSRQVEYHPAEILVLTHRRNPAGEQCLVGSLTGAVAS